jgi:hypothetical protein
MANSTRFSTGKRYQQRAQHLQHPAAALMLRVAQLLVLVLLLLLLL